MKKDSYFDLMRETSNMVFPYIIKHIDKIKDIDEKLYSNLMFIIEKRKGNPLVRPFLVRLAYEICEGNNWQMIIPACAAFELLNISSYQANSAFDNKLGVLTKQQKDSQFMAAMITRELCSEMLFEMESDFDLKTLRRIDKCLGKSNKYIYIAQHYDLNLLVTNNLNRYCLNENLFWEDYIKRCEYGSGFFNSQAAYIGGLLADGDPLKLEALCDFGNNYGIGLQIMNDLVDFVPCDTDSIINRSYQDQLSDIQNGRLTLGVYKLLKRAGIRADWISTKIIRQEKFNDTELVQISQYIVNKGIVDFITSVSSEYAKKAKKSLVIFEDSYIKNSLCLMTSICYSNKYLKCFSQIAKQRKTKEAIDL